MKPDAWTLALQTVNVLILLWVLRRFLFKPIQAIIEQRQQAARQLTAEATAAKDRADQERAAIEAERGALASSRAQALEAAQAEAREAREALLAEADQEARQRTAAAQTALRRERAEVEASLRAKAAVLAGDMAHRLLERLPAGSWNRHFIEGACTELAALAPAERDLLRSGDEEGAEVQVVSAHALDGDERGLVQSALNAALGRAPAVRFSADERLIAGVELRLRHLVIRNHWAADLEQLAASCRE